MAAQNGNVNVNDQKNQIIDLVRDKPMIYDKAHPVHFGANLRTEIWEEIGAQVGLPGK